MTFGSLTKFGLAATFAAAVALLAPGANAAAEQPDSIRIDYAYYNPVSLVLKDRGWLEEEFAADGIEVEWVLSLGSNKALELLNSSSVDFGSTAGAAALIGKIYGNPIKVVYIYSQPEWTALVTRADTSIQTVKDLKGKRVAVTRGTDPHIFLLRALNRFGLTERDIEPVLLQHPDGKTALMNGDVDAWAGLDPHMAQVELNEGARLFFRDASLNTYGVLNVREEFAEEHPKLVERVLAVYERARKWSIEHPAELRQALVEAAKISDPVAEKQLTERTDLSDPVPGAAHRESIAAAGIVLQASGIIDEDEDIAARVDELLDPHYIEGILEAQAVLR